MLHTPSNSSVTEQLWVLLERPIRSEDRQRAALHLIDWLGCAMIGRITETGSILAADALWDAFPFAPEGVSLAAETNAFALGGLGSLYEMDDLHRAALLHPGPVVVSAALAFGADVSGTAVLDAIVQGYEAMIRIGAAVGPSHYAFYHNTGTCGGFGAAAAGASILGLDRAKTVSALGLAGSVAGGLWQCRNEPVASKAFHVAEATRRGVAAARLAQKGLTAPRFILEGPQGFFAAQAPDGNTGSVLIDPEGGWKIWETSFKPWPACRHVHPTIDAVLALRSNALRKSSAEIADISIETYADAIVFCDRPHPRTELQAKFSLQHAAAVALLRGKPQLDDFNTDAIDRSDAVRFREKIRVTSSRTFSDAYPRHFGSKVKVTLVDGAVFSETVADALGDSENPMRDDDIVTKARMLMMAAGVSPHQIDALVTACLALADGAPLSGLRSVAQNTH